MQVTPQELARHKTQETARALFADQIRVTDWSEVTGDLIWYDSEFNWEIMMRYRSGPQALEVAIWDGDQLAALVEGSPAGNRMLLRFVEANPDIKTALKGQRMFLAVDVAANYAELTGRDEVRLFPKAEEVRNLCLTKLGFQLTDNGHIRFSLT